MKLFNLLGVLALLGCSAQVSPVALPSCESLWGEQLEGGVPVSVNETIEGGAIARFIVPGEQAQRLVFIVGPYGLISSEAFLKSQGIIADVPSRKCEIEKREYTFVTATLPLPPMSEDQQQGGGI